jgi:Fe-S oxidoreductase
MLINLSNVVDPMAIFGLFKGKTLYFPGCTAKYVAKDIQRRHEQLLTMFEIEYVKFPELAVCCGKPASDYGFKDDYKSLVKKNQNMFKNQKIKKIITSCPQCYWIFKEEYDNIEVLHISQVILNNMDKIDLKTDEAVCFYDAVNPNKLDELYNNPREILKAVGMNIQEFEYNKKLSLDCGVELQPVSPKVADKMAEEILKNVETRKLIVMCPTAYVHLKKNNPYGVKVLELSEVLL